MRLIGHLVVRSVAILLGLSLAFLAAGIFLSAGLFGGWFSEFLARPEFGEADSQTMTALLVVVAGFFSSFEIAAIALLPAALAIAIAEAMRWRGLTVNLVLGGLVGLASGWLLTGPGAPEISQGTALVLMATGFVGAFVYWLVAGRGAGAWLD